MLELIFLGLFFVQVQSQIDCGAISLSTSNQATILNDLWTYCLTDRDCIRVYEQRPPNITVFAYLTRSLMEDTDFLETPIIENICNQTTDNATQYLWILILKATVFGQQVCDINHRLVVDKHSLSSECVCQPDATCRDSAQHITYLYIIIIFTAVIAVGILIINVIESCKRIKNKT
jgi:hypothetical protein